MQLIKENSCGHRGPENNQRERTGSLAAQHLFGLLRDSCTCLPITSVICLVASTIIFLYVYPDGKNNAVVTIDCFVILFLTPPSSCHLLESLFVPLALASTVREDSMVPYGSETK